MLRRFISYSLCLLVAVTGVGIAVDAKPAPKPAVKKRAPARFQTKDFTANVKKDLAPQEDPVGDQVTEWAQFQLTVNTDKKTYKVGELTDITITSDKDCYVIVYYINSEGKSRIICPSPFSSNNLVKAYVPFSLRDNKGRQLKQAGPTGTEVLQVVATDQPLDLAKLDGLKLPPAASKPMANPNPDDVPPVAVAQVTTVGPPIEVVNSDEFVNDCEKAIRTRVVQRAKSLAKKYRGKNIGEDDVFEPADAVFGLGTTNYQVTK